MNALLHRNRLVSIGAGLGAGLGGVAMAGNAWLERERDRHYREFVEEMDRRDAAREAARRAHVRELGHEFRIDPNEPTFARVREARIFPRDEVWRTTASAEAFHAVGRSLNRNEETRDLLEETDLTIAMPGAGRLLSPLELGIQMAEQSRRLERIRFVGTDINAHVVRGWKARLEELVAGTAQFSAFEVREEPHPEMRHEEGVTPGRTIVRFAYTTTQGRRVAFECVMELAMSGEQYIRPEVAERSNLMVLHDLDRREFDALGRVDNFGTKTAGDVYTLLMESTIEVHREPRYVLLESDEREPWVMQAIGREVFHVSGHYFGCGENHLREGTAAERSAFSVDQPPHAQAVWLELDTEFLSQIREQPREFVCVLAALISPADLERKLHYSPHENVRALQRFIRRLLDLPQGFLRQRILEIMRDHVTLMEQRPPVMLDDAKQRYDRFYRPLLTGLARLANAR